MREIIWTVLIVVAFLIVIAYVYRSDAFKKKEEETYIVKIIRNYFDNGVIDDRKESKDSILYFLGDIKISYPKNAMKRKFYFLFDEQEILLSDKEKGVVYNIISIYEESRQIELREKISKVGKVGKSYFIEDREGAKDSSGLFYSSIFNNWIESELKSDEDFPPSEESFELCQDFCSYLDRSELKDSEQYKNMTSCLLSILDSLKLFDNGSLDLSEETLSEVMFRNMQAYGIDLNQELGFDHLCPVKFIKK